VPAPPRGLRHAKAPLIQLPFDDFATPLDDLLTHRYMVWSTDGFPELVNGISGVIPRRTLELGELARGFPDGASVAGLRAAGVRSVVLHPELARDTAWAGAADQPVEGLGIGRRVMDDIVVFDLNPSPRSM
jgi:hypothetical protein